MIYLMYKFNNCAMFSNKILFEMFEKEIKSQNSMGYIEKKDISQLETMGWNKINCPEFNRNYLYYMNNIKDLIVLIPIEKVNLEKQHPVLDIVKTESGTYNLHINVSKGRTVYDLKEEVIINDIPYDDIRDFIRRTSNI